MPFVSSGVASEAGGKERCHLWAFLKRTELEKRIDEKIMGILTCPGFTALFSPFNWQSPISSSLQCMSLTKVMQCNLSASLL